MRSTSANDSVSVFKDGKLKPGIYKIQNIVGHTYADIRENTRELCCRPTVALEGKGLWEILPSGLGYTIRRIEPGRPEQFCTVLEGLNGGNHHISVAGFPVAWRMEVVNDKPYRGYEYVRFFWGTTNLAWDLAGNGSEKDLTRIQYVDNHDLNACRIWKLIPIKSDAGSQPAPQTTSTQTSGSGSLPPYDGNPVNQHCTHTCSHQAAETNDDECGTTVVEVTVTTITKTKKYRIEE